MKLNEIINEKYDRHHKCKTPGAIYTTQIHSNKITTKVKLPMDLDLSKSESVDLEADLHYAIEKVLSRFF